MAAEDDAGCDALGMHARGPLDPLPGMQRERAIGIDARAEDDDGVGALVGSWHEAGLMFEERRLGSSVCAQNIPCLAYQLLTRSSTVASNATSLCAAPGYTWSSRGVPRALRTASSRWSLASDTTTS